MKQFFDNLAQKIRKAYEGVRPDSAEGRAVLEMRDSVERIQGLFAEALVDASENYRGTNDTKNTAQEGGVKYQDRPAGYDYSKPFDQQIDDYKNGIIPSGDTLIVGETPDIFKQIGFNALPMSINATHVDYALKGTKDADHYIDWCYCNGICKRFC